MAHFYTDSGELVAFVPYAGTREGMRPATLADARKHYPDWRPSTTTVLSERDKPQLDDWRIREALKVALVMGVTEVTDEVMREVTRQSEQYRDWAMSFGTAVHDGISHAYKTGNYVTESPLLGVVDIVDGFMDWADKNALVINESELSFSSSLGWGGTIDGLGTFWGEPGLFDWKTQDYGGPGDKNQKAVFYDPEYPLQMASYCMGLWPERDSESRGYMPRISFVISRTVPGLVTPHQWKDEARYDAGWLSLFEHWCCVHRWGDKWGPRTKLEILQGGLSLED